MLQNHFHMGKNAQRLFKYGDFFYAHSFDRSFYRTVVYSLLIYTRLTICAENLLLLHPIIARLSTETAAFGFFFASVFVLDVFRCSLLLLIAVVFTVVSLSVICRPSRPFIRSLLLLPSPCHSVVYFSFLSPLSAS